MCYTFLSLNIMYLNFFRFITHVQSYLVTLLCFFGLLGGKLFTLSSLINKNLNLMGKIPMVASHVRTRGLNTHMQLPVVVKSHPLIYGVLLPWAIDQKDEIKHAFMILKINGGKILWLINIFTSGLNKLSFLGNWKTSIRFNQPF